MTTENLVARGVWEIIREVEYPGYEFIVGSVGDCAYLQARYSEPDVDSADPDADGQDEFQYTRKWLIEPEWSKEQVVQTALKLVLTSHEHRVREHFRWNGSPVFKPHFKLEDLADMVDGKLGQPTFEAMPPPVIPWSDARWDPELNP